MKETILNDSKKILVKVKPSNTLILMFKNPALAKYNLTTLSESTMDEHLKNLIAMGIM
jgi:hypothetical protein